MKRLFGIALASLALSGCGLAPLNLGGLTPGQNLFQAHGYYNVALGAATDYAETPSANAKVVATATDINREVKPKLEYAQKVIRCAGPDLNIENVEAVAECAGLDASTSNVLRQAGLIRSAGRRILLALGKGV